MDIDSHPERVSNLREFTDNYDWSGLEFPVSLKQIGTFEAKNNISINVLGLEGKDIYIFRNSNRSDREINLLMISEDGINHYTVIKSLSRLLSSSNSKHKHKQHFCTNYLQGFDQELSRDRHQVYCEDNETVRVEIPQKGSKIEFCDGQNQFKVPFIMYTDFESILEPIQGPNPEPMGTHRRLPNTPPLVGVFTANSLTEKLRIHLNIIEVKIVLRNFGIISGRKLIGCITFPENPWIL